jgi:hypothetical protein
MAKVRPFMLKVTGDVDEKAMVAMFSGITNRKASRVAIAEARRRELKSMRRDEDVRGKS